MLSAFSSLRITPAIRQPIVMEQAKRYATKKMGASKARQKKRPPGKRLGLKKYPGMILCIRY